MKVNVPYFLAIQSAITLAAPKRRPAPRAKPALSAALNTANSVTTGAHGNPGATTASISAPASVTAAMRWTPQAAPATAVRPASPWEHALPAAGSTTAHMPSLRLRTGIRMPKTTGLAAPSATKRKLRWAHISSFRAPLARALNPQPPAFLRPCTTRTALTATTRERILIYPHGNDLTRTTTTWCTTTPRRPPAPKLAGMHMTPASARAALTPPRWKSLR